MGARLQRAAVAVCCLTFFFSLSASHSFSQHTEPQRTEQARLHFPLDGSVDDVLRIDTDLVAIDVSVTDQNGRPVRSLKLEDFKLYEDSSERPISFFGLDRKNGNQHRAHFRAS